MPLAILGSSASVVYGYVYTTVRIRFHDWSCWDLKFSSYDCVDDVDEYEVFIDNIEEEVGVKQSRGVLEICVMMFHMVLGKLGDIFRLM